MSTVKTGVQLFIFVGLIGFVNFANGGDDTGRVTVDYEKAEVRCQNQKNWLEGEDQAKCLDRLVNGAHSNQSCDKATDNAKQSKKDLLAICEKNQTAGLDECKASIDGCSEIVHADDQEVEMTSSGAPVYSPEEVANMNKKCPAYVAERMKDWKKISETGQDKIDKLQEDLNKAKKEQQDIMKRMQDQATQMDEQIQKITTEEQDIIKKTPTIITDLTNQMKGQIVQLQQQFAQDQQQLINLQTAEEQAIEKYNDDVGKIGAQCRQAAIQSFRDIVTKNQSNNAGGLVGLINSPANGTALQNRMINWDCNQPSVFEAKQAAARARDVAINANSKMIDQLNKRIANEPTLLNNLYAEMNNKQKQLVADAQTKLTQLANQKSTLTQKLASQSASDAQALQLSQQRQSQITQKLQTAQTDYALANSNIKAGGSVNAGSFENASSGIMANLTGRFSDFEGDYCNMKTACNGKIPFKYKAADATGGMCPDMPSGKPTVAAQPNTGARSPAAAPNHKAAADTGKSPHWD